MKALLLEYYNRLVYTDIPRPEPGRDEALVRVRACGICGSDVHGLDGSTGRRIPPLVMGHEAAGFVETVGAEVQDFRPGERVTFDSTIYCGECGFCRAGRVNLCSRRRVIGVSCDEYRQHGAFAEFVAVPRRSLYRLPEGLAFEAASTVEPLSVAVHAVGRAVPGTSDSALVLGAGMIGLLVVQLLKIAGCGPVIVADLDPERLALARTLGADEIVDSRTDSPCARARDLTGDRGVNCAFDCVGLEATLEEGVESVVKGGALVLVGNLVPRPTLALQKVVARELTLYGSCASAGEYPECLDLLARGAVNVEPLISASVPLSEGAAWFERLRAGGSGLIKVCLIP